MPIPSRSVCIALFLTSCLAFPAMADNSQPVSDQVLAEQKEALSAATLGAGFGPQSPRDLTQSEGKNRRIFATAPSRASMNLCNIHFHENAEHRGGRFLTYAGNGDGEGNGTGFKYDGTLSAAEMEPLGRKIGEGKHGDLAPGDTIEVHYVHTTAQVVPGPTLGSCLSESLTNPQLRVEAQVMVLVNDETAESFIDLAKVGIVNGYHQAVGIPTDTGDPIQYAGSTTGPSYNKKGSPFQVTWSVRPEVKKVSIQSMEEWLSGNVFAETAAHGVRNLVTNLDLLSPIK